MGLNAELLSPLPLYYYLRISSNFSNLIFQKEKQTTTNDVPQSSMVKRDKTAGTGQAMEHGLGLRLDLKQAFLTWALWTFGAS